MREGVPGEGADASGGTPPNRETVTLKGAPAPPQSVAAIREEKYDPLPGTDTARRNLAYTLTGLLILIVVLSFAVVIVASFFPPSGTAAGAPAITALDSLLKLVFAPVIGLVGSVLGFYFGGRTARESAPGNEGRE